MNEDNSNSLVPISSACSDNGTLYIFIKSCDCKRQLVLCNREIKDGIPVFLSIGNSEPVSLFSGRYHFEVVYSDCKIVFINHILVINSSSSYIKTSSLPNGEKATMAASFFDSVFALSSSRRVFVSDLKSRSCVLNFSAVSELSGEEIVWLSGTQDHCFAVRRYSRIFGRGSIKRLFLLELIRLLTHQTCLLNIIDQTCIYYLDWKNFFYFANEI